MPADKPENGARQNSDQRISPRQDYENGHGRGNCDGQGTSIRSARYDDTTRQDQAHGDRRQRLPCNIDHVEIRKALHQPADCESQQTGWQQHGQHRDGEAGPARDLPANHADDHHIRARRHLRDGKAIGEGRIVHPVQTIDDLPVDLGHGRGRTANRNNRDQRKGFGERAKQSQIYRVLVLSARRAMLTGTTASKVQSKGNCRIPEETKTAIPMR